MLIYAVADIHGHPKRIQAIRSQVADHRPDLMVVAGDLSKRWHPERALRPLDRCGLPILLVRGNSDSRRIDTLLKHYPNLHNLHRDHLTIDGVDFVGISGTVPLPFHSRLGLRETDLVNRMKSMLRAQSVLVVHPPPYGIRDRALRKFHAGSRAVRRIVEACSPAVVICGHIHEQSGIAMVGRTAIVNCAMTRRCQGALIRYDGISAPDCLLVS